MDGRYKENRRRNNIQFGRFCRAWAILLAAFLIRQPAGAQEVRAAGWVFQEPAITLEDTRYTMLAGQKIKLKATVWEERLQSETIVWSASPQQVLTVSQNGTVKAKSEGTALVTASVKGTGEAVTCQIHVVKKAAQKKNAKDVAAIKKIIQSQPGASLSKDLDSSQYTWTDMGKQSRLTRIAWPDTGLEGKISFAGLPKLEALDIRYGNLPSLNISKNPALKELDCSFQQLEALDTSAHPSLEALSCSGNQLTALDLRKNKKLIRLSCSENQLTALNTQKNPSLTQIICDQNQLTALDTQQNPSLEVLCCS